MQERQIQSLEWVDLLEEEMAIHSNILAGIIPRTEEPGRLQSMGSQRVGQDRAYIHIYMCVCLIFLMFILKIIFGLMAWLAGSSILHQRLNLSQDRESANS